MAKKIVALDVLTEILKQVYNKTKEYTDVQITIGLGNLRPLIGTNSDAIKTNRDDITTLKNTAKTQQESIDGLSSSVATLQSRLGTAESNIATLQSELATVKSDVADLQSKVYDYLGNDEIDTVFDETEKGA